MKKIRSLSILLIYLSPQLVLAEPKGLLTLDQAVELSRSHSSTLVQSKAVADSAQADAESSKGKLYPKLSLDGNFKEQSVVPEASLGGQNVKLGDNKSYSIGPTLSYVLWDSGSSRNQTKSLEFLSQARQRQHQLSAVQLKLATQIAYTQVVVSQEIADSSSKAEQLARVQNKDIQSRKRGGSASDLDALTSDSEILNYSLKAKQAKADSDSNALDLAYYTGESSSQLQPLSDLVAQVKVPIDSSVNTNHPSLLAQGDLEKSAQYGLDSQKSSHWPTISLQARSSLDYPNFNKLEQINQNTISANLTWTIFDFGGISDSVRSKEYLLASARASTQEAKNALARDLEKTHSKITNLKSQLEDAEVLVKKQEKLAKTNYSTYKFGGIKYSDVQAANLRLLDAEKNLAMLRAQYLVQIFTLQYLMEGTTNE